MPLESGRGLVWANLSGPHDQRIWQAVTAKLLERRASAVATIAASRNSAVLWLNLNYTGDFALYPFLFRCRQIFDRFTVEL